jgi:hypothetical protein
MGFTPTQSTSVLMADTPVSRSLGATFSELTRQPTPPEFRALAPTIAALLLRFQWWFCLLLLRPSRLRQSLLLLRFQWQRQHQLWLPFLQCHLQSHGPSRLRPLHFHFQCPRVRPLRVQGLRMMQLSFRSLTVPQRLAHLLLCRCPILSFWCLTPKGERERVC